MKLKRFFQFILIVMVSSDIYKSCFSAVIVFCFVEVLLNFESEFGVRIKPFFFNYFTRDGLRPDPTR